VEGGTELYVFDGFNSLFILGIHFVFCGFPSFVEFEQYLCVANSGLNGIVLFYPIFIELDDLKNGLSSFWVVPKIGIARQLFFFLNGGQSFRHVKDTPLTKPADFLALRVGRWS